MPKPPLLLGGKLPCSLHRQRDIYSFSRRSVTFSETALCSDLAITDVFLGVAFEPARADLLAGTQKFLSMSLIRYFPFGLNVNVICLAERLVRSFLFGFSIYLVHFG